MFRVNFGKNLGGPYLELRKSSDQKWLWFFFNYKPTTTTPSTSACQNAPGFDQSCTYFSQLSFNFCSNVNAFLNRAPFYVTCQKSCNLCNGGQITSTTTTTSPCRNAVGYDVSCNYFSLPPFSYCNNPLAFLGRIRFSETCKKSCNLC